MQRIGVDAAVLVPNRIVQMGHVSVRDLVVALNPGFIRYMLDRVCDPAQGVYTMVIACWQDPVASAELIHEVADDPAVVGVCLMSAGANPSLGDVCYDPIYQAAQECGLPVVFHSAPGLNFVEGSDYASFQRLIESHSLGLRGLEPDPADERAAAWASPSGSRSSASSSRRAACSGCR